MNTGLCSERRIFSGVKSAKWKPLLPLIRKFPRCNIGTTTPFDTFRVSLETFRSQTSGGEEGRGTTPETSSLLESAHAQITETQHLPQLHSEPFSSGGACLSASHFLCRGKGLASFPKTYASLQCCRVLLGSGCPGEVFVSQPPWKFGGTI